QLLALAPSGGTGPSAHSLDVVGIEARHHAEPLVVTPLVLAAAVVRDAQDQELRVGARQHAARHQRAGEPQPAPKQAPVPSECREYVRWLAAGDGAGAAREQ